MAKSTNPFVSIRLKESLSCVLNYFSKTPQEITARHKKLPWDDVESSFRGEGRVREENYLKEPRGCSPFFGTNHRVVFRGRGKASGNTSGYSTEARGKNRALHFSAL